MSFWERIRAAVADAATSKKFGAMVGGVIVAIAGRYGFGAQLQDLALLLAPIIAYIAAQGVADLGKSAAQIDSAADSEESP